MSSLNHVLMQSRTFDKKLSPPDHTSTNTLLLFVNPVKKIIALEQPQVPPVRRQDPPPRQQHIQERYGFTTLSIPNNFSFSHRHSTPTHPPPDKKTTSSNHIRLHTSPPEKNTGKYRREHDLEVERRRGDRKCDPILPDKKNDRRKK